MSNKITQEQAKAYAIILIVIVALVVVIYVLNDLKKGKNSLLEGLGLKEDKTDKESKNQKELAEKLGYFRGENFLKGKPLGTLLLTQKNADIKAQNIYNAIGVLTDKPEQIKSAFDNLITQSQIAFVSMAFKKRYGIDLLAFLFDRMDTDKQQSILIDILTRTNSLKKYK